MRKVSILLVLLALLLTGCAAEETFETVADEQVQPVLAVMQQLSVQLPSEAASPAVESGDSRLYQCREYDICVQTLEGGDLNRTVEILSGYSKDTLTVMETEGEGLKCYEFVWASVSESGDQVGRAKILDDGSYHYCVSILADAAAARENQVYWDEMFGSMSLQSY